MILPHGLAQGAGRSPESSAPDASTEVIEWHHDGLTDRFEAKIWGGDFFVPVEQMARMSTSQLRWQTISQQACLSRNTGLLCFNWERAQIYVNGETTPYDYSLHYETNQLYIPIHFVTSKAFEKFSQREFYWNTAKKRLTQLEPVTLVIPPIEDMGDRYRMALAIKGPVSYHMLENNSQRVWIRFIRAQTEGSEILEGDNIIRQIRVVQKRRTVDLIVDLGSQARSHEVYVEQGTRKLIMDVFKSDDEPSLPMVKKSTVKQRANLFRTPGPVKKQDIPPPSVDDRIFTVVIDPGHGGMDPGAIGPRGTFEKDINLKTAKMMAGMLSKYKNVRVIMTRESDEFLTLSERTHVANHTKADVFISLHCNSSISVKSTGFEAYILSRDATDQAAEAVARIENSVVALESKKGEEGSRISELLASMAVHTNINESSRCAGYIMRSINKRTSIQKASVREANFHVLRGAEMPGVLVELGYISNPISELQLRSSRYQNQIGRGVVEGVLMFRDHQENARKATMMPSQSLPKKVYQ